MNTSRHALLVVGSGRGRQSNSYQLGSYLLARLSLHGWRTETELLLPALKADGGEALASAARRVDLLVLAFPLYVDSLPAALIGFLERLATSRPVGPEPPLVCAIVNCGFPGAHHNRIALSIVEQFCRESAWRWAGGLPMGGGEVIGGQELDKQAWLLRHQRAALDRAAEDLSAAGSLSPEAVDLMGRPAIPTWYYLMKANSGFLHEAAKHGVADCLDLRPYEEETARTE